ncbi:MAG: hypothetical protein JWQ72_26 [Polaromonas sp.]|nr:hypothetical protein [Polaromonas sp.]
MRPTIFHERWWLDAVTGGHYEAAELHEGGRLVGWLPYVVSRRHIFRVSVMPDLTHLMGPVMDEGAGGSNKRWLRRLDILAELAGQLPRLGLFSQTCHPDTPDVLGFQACGFGTSVQFSAEIAPAPSEMLWRAMRDKTRNVIRRAGERWEVEVLDDPQRFCALYRDNLEHNQLDCYFDLAHITTAFRAAHQRGRARIVGLRNAQHQWGAAVFYVWDDHRLWYLLSSRDGRVADNGAVSLLIWHAIQEAAQRHIVFDFDGIASAGSARFYAGFGASIKPRFGIHRTSRGFDLADSLAHWVRGWSHRNHFTAP